VVDVHDALKGLRVLAAAILLVAAGGCDVHRAPASPTQGSPPPAAASARLDRDLTDSDDQRALRNKLVDTFVAPVVKDTRVLEAMRTVPRHSFVPTEELERAYGDYPLPIGYGQTISQPSLVAYMTELLDLQTGERVLEIGTGSGYQAAILRELTDRVYSVEIVPELAATARAVLEALEYHDVRIDRRDGYLGWPEYGPYDAIIVTAAPDHLPSPLVEQLAPGGRIVIPIGPPGDVQTLWLVTRDGGETKMERLMAVQFVPLTRDGH
jgi:protein-L-isoaspartate(D-aspartate) O-methyltransferase